MDARMQTILAERLWVPVTWTCDRPMTDDVDVDYFFPKLTRQVLTSPMSVAGWMSVDQQVGTDRSVAKKV